MVVVATPAAKVVLACLVAVSQVRPPAALVALREARSAKAKSVSEPEPMAKVVLSAAALPNTIWEIAVFAPELHA
jgi:hypothetical protein